MFCWIFFLASLISADRMQARKPQICHAAAQSRQQAALPAAAAAAVPVRVSGDCTGKHVPDSSDHGRGILSTAWLVPGIYEVYRLSRQIIV